MEWRELVVVDPKLARSTWKEPWAARGSLVHGFGLDIDDAFVEGCVEHVVELVVAPITTNGGFHPSSGEEGEWTHEHPRSR
jgi:hypothetical protein